MAKLIAGLYLTFLNFIPFLIIGQTINDSLLVSFYNKTITTYFSDTSNHKDQSKFNEVLIFTNLHSDKLIENIDQYHFEYYPYKLIIQDVVGYPLKKNNGRFIYYLNHLSFGIDTVDINLKGETIVEMDKNSYAIGIWCGGTVGYIPAARFIFNRSKNSWDFYDHNTLIDLKFNSERYEGSEVTYNENETITVKNTIKRSLIEYNKDSTIITGYVYHNRDTINVACSNNMGSFKIEPDKVILVFDCPNFNKFEYELLRLGCGVYDRDISLLKIR